MRSLGGKRKDKKLNEKETKRTKPIIYAAQNKRPKIKEEKLENC